MELVKLFSFNLVCPKIILRENILYKKKKRITVVDTVYLALFPCLASDGWCPGNKATFHSYSDIGKLSIHIDSFLVSE